MPDKKLTISLLNVNYGHMADEVKKLEPLADWFQVDVMDGNFVPNISVGPYVMKAIKTDVPLDVHLMINNPHRYLEQFAEAGAYSITVHAEASRHLSDDIDKIKALGCKAAAALNPETPVDKIAHVLPKLDMVLIMTVNPGFGGQAFLEGPLKKVQWLREHYPDLEIQADGGITDKTAPLCLKAGANNLAVGSFITKSKDPKKAAEKLRSLMK